MKRIAHLLSLGALALAGSRAGAQGVLGSQGFGYPIGGVSSRAAGAGAGFAEFDPTSTRNPSAISAWGRGGIFFQYEPEFRRLSGPGGSENTLTARFPIAMLAVALGSSGMLSLSSSTLLDRTWETQVRGGQRLGDDSVEFLETVGSSGAINDFRLGVAWTFGTKLSIGGGAHALTGRNRLTLSRVFDDSTSFGALERALTLGYSGTALSAGAVVRPITALAISASARWGGELTLRIEDSTSAKATVPGRYGFGVRFDGIPGVSLGASAEHVTWSDMAAIGSSDLSAIDTWEYGAGAELLGPRMRGAVSLFRLGYRTRDLPFAANGAEVSEKAYTAGAGLPISGSRAVFDVAIQRVSRSAVSAIDETAWIVSFGLTVRP
jgi:hypothetical protein